MTKKVSKYSILSKYDDAAVAFTVDPNKGKYAALTTAYEEMLSCVTKLTELRNNIEHDFNPDNDIYFSNPLEYGPRKEIETSIHNCKEYFIKFIVKQIANENIYQNLDINEEAIFRDFGIGYLCGYKYGPEFCAKDVETSFNEMYPLHEIETTIYRQILQNAKKSLAWSGARKTTEIDRFKNGTGVVLSYCTTNYYGTNNNYTTSLIKLIEIELVPVKPSNAKSVYVEPGEAYSSLSCVSIRG